MNNAVTNICVQVCVDVVFTSLGYIPRNGIAGSARNSMFNIWGELPDCFSKQLYYFRVPPAMYEVSNFSTSLSTFVTTRLFDYSHPDEFEIVSHCAFFVFVLFLFLFGCVACGILVP